MRTFWLLCQVIRCSVCNIATKYQIAVGSTYLPTNASCSRIIHLVVAILTWRRLLLQNLTIRKCTKLINFGEPGQTRKIITSTEANQFLSKRIWLLRQIMKKTAESFMTVTPKLISKTTITHISSNFLILIQLKSLEDPIIVNGSLSRISSK